MKKYINLFSAIFLLDKKDRLMIKNNIVLYKLTMKNGNYFA